MTTIAPATIYVLYGFLAAGALGALAFMIRAPHYR